MQLVQRVVVLLVAFTSPLHAIPLDRVSPLAILESLANASDALGDRAVLRTLSHIHGKGTTGELLLLVCNSTCHRLREQIPRWIRGASDKRNESDDAIAYHYHLLRPPAGKELHFPSLIYIVAGRAHIYPGPVDTEARSTVIAWLADLRDWTTGVNSSLAHWTHLDRVLDAVSTCEDGEHKWLLMIHDPVKCPIPNWKNVLRSSKTLANVSILLLNRPLAPQIEVLLRSRLRLAQSAAANCQHLILLHNNASISLAITSTPAQVRASIRQFSHNCDELSEDGRRGISPSLSDVQMDYLSREFALTQLEYNASYIVVGVTGGIAVIALAISIFWGLNGSAFASQK